MLTAFGIGVGRIIYTFADISLLYSKLTQDMAEAQLENGLVPDIAPEYVVFDGGFRDSPEWGIAFIMIPMFLYDEYNDTSTLRSAYPAMKRYIEYLTGRADSLGIISYGLGDWTEVQQSPIGVTATMVYVEGLQTMRRAAVIIGASDDANRFEILASKSVAGYTATFFNASTGDYAGCQTATAMALALGVAQDASLSLGWLIGDIERSDYRVVTGEIGWPYMVRCLSASGRNDVLQAMLSHVDAPSYGFQLTQGATTLTESFSADPTSSWNHAMDGHIDSWFYETVGGLQVTAAASSTVLFAPKPIAGIHWAEVSRVVASGSVRMRWEQTNATRLLVSVSVPAGSTVHLGLPTADATQVRWSDGSSRLIPDPRRVLLHLAPGNHVLSVECEWVNEVPLESGHVLRLGVGAAGGAQAALGQYVCLP
jgi:hypothetical protein